MHSNVVLSQTRTRLREVDVTKNISSYPIPLFLLSDWRHVIMKQGFPTASNPRHPPTYHFLTAIHIFTLYFTQHGTDLHATDTLCTPAGPTSCTVRLRGVSDRHRRGSNVTTYNWTLQTAKLHFLYRLDEHNGPTGSSRYSTDRSVRGA